MSNDARVEISKRLKTVSEIAAFRADNLIREDAEKTSIEQDLGAIEGLIKRIRAALVTIP